MTGYKKPRRDWAALSDFVEQVSRLGKSQLEWARDLHQAKEEALKTERGRLIAKHGRESAHIAEIDARMSGREKRLAVINAQIERASIETPDPREGHAAVFGRIADANGTGIAGMTVRVVGRDGTTIESARTDERGHFEITFSADKPKTYRLEVKHGTRTVHREKELRTAAPARPTYRELTIDPDSPGWGRDRP
jgi:hypothetical protein